VPGHFVRNAQRLRANGFEKVPRHCLEGFADTSRKALFFFDVSRYFEAGSGGVFRDRWRAAAPCPEKHHQTPLTTMPG
jgi:hypothetical protein